MTAHERRAELTNMFRYAISYGEGRGRVSPDCRVEDFEEIGLEQAMKFADRYLESHDIDLPTEREAIDIAHKTYEKIMAETGGVSFGEFATAVARAILTEIKSQNQ